MRRGTALVLACVLGVAGVSTADGPRRGRGRRVDDPHKFVSAHALLATVAELVNIRAFQGYRTTASPGELEALELVRSRLAAMPHLARLGLDLEVQPFHMPFGIEPHVSQLWLTVDGITTEVPASATIGLGRNILVNRQFDSDGSVGDLEPDPVDRSGAPLLMATTDEILALTPAAVEGRVLVVDYQAIDISFVTDSTAWRTINDAKSQLRELPSAGIVFITAFHDDGELSEGTGSTNRPIEAAAEQVAPPRMVVRIEDLAGLGIGGWNDLAAVQEIRMLWDADVVCPGPSGNLIATIPGIDRSRNLVLGAHLDSVNNPGALDDGSGIAALLEVARVIDHAELSPPVDIVLAFFGGEEPYLYGSTHFASSHEELLDRSLAFLQVDCLTSPREGVPRSISLAGRIPAVIGSEQQPLAEYLTSTVGRLDIWPKTVNGLLESDNLSTQGFAVPNANLIFWDVDGASGAHTFGHLHSPYDDLPMVEREIDVLVDMTHVALATALSMGVEDPELDPFPPADLHLVAVATHTEPAKMSPAGMSELGPTLAAHGIDINVVPFGTALTAAHLDGAAAVLTLPVYDYPVPEAEVQAYDESWTEAEITLLEAYVEAGGLLLVSHATGQLGFGNWVDTSISSEDGTDDNQLAERFGFSFDLAGEPLGHEAAHAVGDHPLVSGLDKIVIGMDSGTAVDHDGATLIQNADGRAVAASVEFGNAGGEVIAIGDLGILADDVTQWPAAHNIELWESLARYIRNR